MAAEKTTNFPMNPAVSGIPAKESRKTLIVAASNGERLASPAQSVSRAWPRMPLRRTVVSSTNPPMVAMP